MSLRTVILPAGGRLNAFNWFIGNDKGTAQVEANNEFGVDENFISQADLDQKRSDYAAYIATVHQDYGDFLADEAKDRRKDRFDDNSHTTAHIKEMVILLNELRALHGLPDLNFGQVNASIRNRID